MEIQEIIRYVGITLGVALILFVPILIIRGIYLHRNNRWCGMRKRREIAIILFIFYMLCLYQITALRFGGIGWNIENMLARNTRVNVVPLAELWNWTVKGVWWHLFYNVIGNFAWFVPLGILVPALFKRQRRLWKVMFIGAIVSASIEGLQYLLCTGVTDIDDIILNTIGTGMGYGIWFVLDKIYEKLKLKYGKRNIPS